MMFSRTVRHASSTWFWNTMPMSAPGPLTARPAISIEPDVGANSPAISFSSVLLPQPLGPTTDKNSPSRIANSSGFNDCTSPSAVRYDFATPRTRISGVAAALSGAMLIGNGDSRQIFERYPILGLAFGSRVEATVLREQIERFRDVVHRHAKWRRFRRVLGVIQ